MKEKKYEEVGNNYRFFLRWRHALVAGMVLILFGVASLFFSVKRDAPGLAWLVPFVGSPLGILFWWIDVRTRDLIHVTQVAGKALEGQNGGPYTRIVDDLAVPKDRSPFSRVTLTGAMNVLFFGSTIAMVVLGILAFFF